MTYWIVKFRVVREDESMNRKQVGDLHDSYEDAVKAITGLCFEDQKSGAKAPYQIDKLFYPRS